MGLERLACIMQDVDSIFAVDTIKFILDKVVDICKVSYFKDTLHLGPTVFKYDVFDVCNEHGVAYNGRYLEF